MTRFIIVTVLLTALLALAALEQIYINDTYAALKTDAEALYAVLYQPNETAPINTQANKDKIDKIYNYWLEKEQSLCLLARHIDLTQISDAIIYARNFVYFDDRKEACNGLSRLMYLIDTYRYNVGTSIQNVI